MYKNLTDHIRKYVALSEAEEEVLLSYLHYRELKKKEKILHEGQVCESNYFILRGCLRLYVITDKGTEQIIQFGIDNWWISDYNSFDRQVPSGCNIQAIEHSGVAMIHKRDQQVLFSKIPQLEAYFRVVFQRAYAASLMRIQYIFCLSGEERYYQFNRHFPEFVQRVPQYMLASFLGFTPEFLSKTRAKKKSI